MFRTGNFLDLIQSVFLKVRSFSSALLAFGPASTRAICVDSSDSLYDRLLESTPNKSLLPFETLSQIAYDNKGNLMRDKAKALIRLFRPDRRGYLTKLDFVSSIDTVYKDLRLFRASLANSSTIDDSFEVSE